MPTIRFVKPVPTEADALAADLRRWTAPSTELEMSVVSRDGPDNLEYHTYEALAAPGILAEIAAAERAGCDAAIIGCFYDTALDAARELTGAMPVVAPCESALHIAAVLGTRCSIVVGRRKWVPRMRANVAGYGFADRVASFPALDLGVPQLQADPEVTYARLREVGARAVAEDDAEVLVLGCTLEFGFADRLRDELDVPVVDAARAALKYAELAAEIARIGWTTSKRGGYAAPPAGDLVAFGLTDLLTPRDRS